MEILPGQHVIADLGNPDDGPTLIVFGSVHGNEAAGASALSNVAREISDLPLRGRVLFLAGNTRALAQGARFIDSDLNRHWTPSNVARNRGASANESSEDLEQHELLEILDAALARAPGLVFALDLHSTSADGAPFATVGDTLRNRRFARSFPITILLGIEEQLDGTILEYLNNLGCVTLGYEGGQHFADKTRLTHEALAALALVHAGIVERRAAPDVDARERFLHDVTGRPRIVEIRYRHGLSPSDEFEMLPGFENFQPVVKGQKLATQNGADVLAGESGVILMPLYQKQGEDGFFLGREVAPFWLALSALLRKLKVGALMPLLPGVRRAADDRDTLVIDTDIARYFPLQIFHLLGFRKRRDNGNELIVSKRKFD